MQRLIILFMFFTCCKEKSNKVKIIPITQPIVDTQAFVLDTTIQQNGFTFKHWLRKKEIGHGYVEHIIERASFSSSDTIIWKGNVKDNLYEFDDLDNDGCADFITTYKLYNLVHLFNKQTNNFSDTPFCLPADDQGIVDVNKNIRWGYRVAVYGDPHDYSDLYTIKNQQPYFLYRIEFYSKGNYLPRAHVKAIKLYKYIKGDFEQRVFVKDIPTSNPKDFDYSAFWQKHYKELLSTSNH